MRRGGARGLSHPRECARASSRALCSVRSERAVEVTAWAAGGSGGTVGSRSAAAPVVSAASAALGLAGAAVAC